MEQLNKKALQNILDRIVDNKKVFGVSFCVKYSGEIWCGTRGNLQLTQQYFIASTTKLFVTAIILHLQEKGILKLEDQINKYLNADILQGLCTFSGQDCVNEITVKHLLAHTSGIPDYLQLKGKDGESLLSKITNGIDQSWTFDEAIERSKLQMPFFRPGTKGKAHYSDTNFQLLGRIIENITSKSFSANCEELIFKPLGLKQTYLYQDIQDSRPTKLYFKNKELYIPKAMSSFGPDGGIVSTSEDMIIFLEAFFTGAFFPATYIDALKAWNRMFFPLQSGVGIHRFKLPWIFNPLGKIPELIGHSGLSGALAYYCPKEKLYVVGTVNQVAHPSISFKVMVKLIQILIRRK